MWRRIGDYRQWGPDYERRRPKGWRRWAEGYELWDLDLRDTDLGLVEDRVEKLIREAESKYLLLDSRAKRVALTAPSGLPRPLLSIVLRGLFEGLQAASVTVLPTSIMTCVGAGVRSALVVDLGWFESTVSAVYEYREVRQVRSVRAGKMLSQELAKSLLKEAGKQGKSEAKNGISLEGVEEVMSRVVWCRSKRSFKEDSTENASDTVTLPVSKSQDRRISETTLPLQALAEPTEVALFAGTTQEHEIDDHDLPLPQLLYITLLRLPIDVRNLCVLHIIFTGGISNIPGLKQRVLDELQQLVDTQGWDPIREYAPRLGLPRPRPRSTVSGVTNGNTSLPLPGPPTVKVTESTTAPPLEEPTVPALPAHARPHDTNPIDTKLTSLSFKDAAPTAPKGEIRAINTLGGWAGASLVTNLRIKGVVEIERDRFMSQGLVGGSVSGSIKPGAASVVQDAGFGRSRQSLGANAKLGEKSSTGWSLGVWA
jgi:hypothetical protein